MQSKAQTKILKENRLDSVMNQSVRQAINGKSKLLSFIMPIFYHSLDSHRDDEAYSIRTPKRLLKQTKRSKIADTSNTKRKTDIMKSSPLRRKTKKKGKSKVKATEDVNTLDPEEGTNFNYFEKDFSKSRAIKKDDPLQSNGIIFNFY